MDTTTSIGLQSSESQRVGAQPSLRPAAGVQAEFRQRNACILCGSQNLQTIWQSSFSDALVIKGVEGAFYSGNPLAYLQGNAFRRSRCQDCGMTFMSDILTDDWLKVLYGEWISASQVDAIESSLERSCFQQTLEVIKHCMRFEKMLANRADRRLRVLDFGCGDGNFLRVASLLGFDAVGIDFSDSRQARNRQLGAVLLYSTLAELRAKHPEDQPFDVITLFQVMEHLADPLDVLKTLAECLEPGGILVMEVPDARGLGDVPTNSAEYKLADPLEHINQFTPDTLALMARRAGFVPAAPSAAYVASQVRAVVREAIVSVAKRSPLKAIRKSTRQYFRKA